MNEETKNRIRTLRERFSEHREKTTVDENVNPDVDIDMETPLFKSLNEFESTRARVVAERLADEDEPFNWRNGYHTERQPELTANYQVSERVDYHDCETCGVRVKCRIIHRVGTDENGNYVNDYQYQPTEPHVCRAFEKRKQDEENAKYVPVSEPEGNSRTKMMKVTNE